MTILKKFFKKSIIKKVLLIILVCILASVCFSAGKKYGVKTGPLPEMSGTGSVTNRPRSPALL